VIASPTVGKLQHHHRGALAGDAAHLAAHARVIAGVDPALNCFCNLRVRPTGCRVCAKGGQVVAHRVWLVAGTLASATAAALA
jgi:hypothetical protein